jgi:chromosome segregation ATPase
MSATIGQIIESRIEQMKHQRAGHEAEIIILNSNIEGLERELDKVKKELAKKNDQKA